MTIDPNKPVSATFMHNSSPPISSEVAEASEVEKSWGQALGHGNPEFPDRFFVFRTNLPIHYLHGWLMFMFFLKVNVP